MSALGNFIRMRLEQSPTALGPTNANSWRPPTTAYSPNESGVSPGMTGPHGHTGFGSVGGLPNFGKMGDMMAGGLSNPNVASLLGGAVAGLPGTILGRVLANRFGGDGEEGGGPEMKLMSRRELNKIEKDAGLGGPRGFGTYRGSAGNVKGFIDPNSLGVRRSGNDDKTAAKLVNESLMR